MSIEDFLLSFAIAYICYRDERKKNPEASSARYEFSANTSNASLRVHLDKCHRDAYETFCKEQKWTNQLLSHKHKAAETQAAGAEGGARSRVKFTKHQFIKHLVNLIVGNDHVSE